jgi:alkanesulfonate monooxygenase SsuD/methylene tetrahydromethanopterin reductase-like flavin-dependent oxidoreductase (luciferase family)
MKTNAWQVLGEALMSWGHDTEKIVEAIKWADTTAKSSGRDVYIMPDLKTVFPEQADRPPLEIIRCIKKEIP